jgi:membrane protease YdiL (CAAX protease family)
MLDAFPLGSLNQVAAVLILTVGAIVAGLLGFFSTVRRFAARWLPLDPDSFPDSVALATTLAMTIGCFIPLIVLRQPPLLVIAKNLKDDFATLANQSSLLELYARLYWTLPVAILAAGFPLVRNFPAALQRLGLVMPSRGQLQMVPICTVFLIGLMLVVDRGIGTVWRQVGLPVTDETTFDQLMKFAKNGAGAIAIGVTAGICEELTFRGLLQPRIGLWPANLLFTAIHAQQYHLDGLLSVFLIGLILGRIRERTNTTTTILIHGLYDFILVLGSAYHFPWFSSGN